MFRTEIQIPPASINLKLEDKVVTIGSCFAEVIGAKLKSFKADVLVNPFGTIFNPVSVGRLLEVAARGTLNLEESLVQRDGIWYSYDLHSSLSAPSRQQLLQLIEKRLEETYEQLKQTKLLIITLGTAVSYRLAESGNIVANCHKLPSKQFSKTLLSTEDVVESITSAYQALKKMNPALQVVLTVSPVRHIKETLPLNSVSKSILRVAAHNLTERFEDVQYFPAYEIMLDDLRDYRFYGPDMLHPTATAEEYIWEKFVTAYLHPSYQGFIPEWEKIRRAVSHRPFHPQAGQHQQFIRKTIEQLQQISEQYGISTKTEELLLQQQFNS